MRPLRARPEVVKDGRFQRPAFVIFATSALVVLGATAFIAFAPGPSLEASEVVAPVQTEIPTVLVPTPTVTPLATNPTESPTSAVMTPWTFSSAHLSAPSIGLEGEISEYVFKVPDEDIDPPTDQTISWDSTIPGGTFSRNTANTVYLYGHSWLNPELYPGVPPAIFNNLRKLEPGATLQITTPTETLTYVMQDPYFTVLKPDLVSDPRLKQATPGRLVLISCYRPDDYDPNSRTVENVVAVFQLVAS